jgi:hypothetical protein
MFGDNIISNYRHLKFIILKIFTSFFIGSLDLSDSKENLSLNLSGSGTIFDEYYNYLFKF